MLVDPVTANKHTLSLDEDDFAAAVGEGLPTPDGRLFSYDACEGGAAGGGGGGPGALWDVLVDA